MRANTRLLVFASWLLLAGCGGSDRSPSGADAYYQRCTSDPDCPGDWLCAATVENPSSLFCTRPCVDFESDSDCIDWFGPRANCVESGGLQFCIDNCSGGGVCPGEGICEDDRCR